MKERQFRSSDAVTSITSVYYINTSEIPSELSRKNFISSRVKITCYPHMRRDHRRYGYIINSQYTFSFVKERQFRSSDTVTSITSVYYINTSEISSEPSRENFISSHVKITCYLHMRRGYIINRAFESKPICISLVFHWCLYNKQTITYSFMDMNFIFSFSTPYLTSELRSLVRYRVDHSKIKFISTRGHVISIISYNCS